MRATQQLLAIFMLGLWLPLPTRSSVAGDAPAVRGEGATELAPEDIEALLALADDLGLTEVEAVQPIRFVAYRVAELFEPKTVGPDQRVIQRVLVACRNDTTYCSDNERLGVTIQRGNWFSAPENVRIDQYWRVFDGDWKQDVILGKGVDLQIATRLIMAVRYRNVRLPVHPPAGAEVLENIDPNDIAEITWADRELLAPEARGSRVYTVRTSHGGSGDLVLLEVRAEEVILVGVGEWVE